MRTTRMNLRDSDRYNEVGMFPNQRFARGISWVALVFTRLETLYRHRGKLASLIDSRTRAVLAVLDRSCGSLQDDGYKYSAPP